jgi:hypothetical protein
MLRYIYCQLIYYIFDARQFFTAIKTPSWFYSDFKNLKLQKDQYNTFEISKLYPIFNERKAQVGIMNGTYFHQDLYVA